MVSFNRIPGMMRERPQRTPTPSATSPWPPFPRRILRALVVLSLLDSCPAPSTAHAQVSAADPWPLRDNSFFLEEASTQEPDLVQSILIITRWRDDPGGRWAALFVQDWPLGSERHQITINIPFTWEDDGRQNGFDDIFLDYRYQALFETATVPAFAPRITLILPTADERDEKGRGRLGLDLGLPFSKAIGDLYLNLNLGSTSRFNVKSPGEEGVGEHLWTPYLGGSVIWGVRRWFNLILETFAEFEESTTSPGRTDRDTRWILSPGFRTGWQHGERVLVLGAAVPFGLTSAAEEIGFLAYFSLELPFK